METPVPASGHFTLHRFNGDEIYSLESAVISATEDEGQVILWFEATAGEDGAQRQPDTADLEMVPYAEVAVALPSLDPDALVGQRLLAAEPYVEELGGRVAFLEYSEQEDLRDNVIEVLSRAGDQFRIRWTGVTTDVNHYDGSEPDTQVEIEGEFVFEDLDQWAG